MINIMKNIRTKALIIICSITVFLVCTVPVNAASKIGAQAEKASNGFVQLLQDMGKPAVMAVIAVIGIGLIIATQRQKENIKDGVLGKIIGVGILVLAVPGADAIWGIF